MISVILTNFNCKSFIRKAIESVLAQTYSDFELIIVDDGSTDGSANIINSFFDLRIKPIFSEHAGFPTAKNIGLDSAAGEYIAFIDSDDIASPLWLETLYQCSKTGADISAVNWELFESEASLKSKPAQRLKIKIYDKTKMTSMWQKPVGSFMWNKLYSRRLFDGLRHKDAPCLSDRIISVELFNRSNFIASASNIAFFHRLHKDSMTNNARSQDWYWKYRVDTITCCIIRSVEIEPYSKYVCRNALLALYSEAEKHIDVSEEKKKMSWLLNDTDIIPITI